MRILSNFNQSEQNALELFLVEPALVGDVVQTVDDNYLYEGTLCTLATVARIYIGVNTGSTMIIYLPDGGGIFGTAQ